MEERSFTVKARLKGMAGIVFVRVLAADWGDARARAEAAIRGEFALDALEKVSSWEVLTDGPSDA